MNQKKAKFAIGSLLIVVGIGYLITTGISKTSKYFFTVGELLNQKVSYEGTGLKVKGNVVDGSINRDPNNYLKVKFVIAEKDAKDETARLNVVYEGVTPDMFKAGGEVVVEGILAADGVFHANTLLTSCPSKYEAEKEAGKMHPGSLQKYDSKEKPVSNSTETLPKATI